MGGAEGAQRAQLRNYVGDSMDFLRQAAQQALEAMDYMLINGEWYQAQDRADALRAALAQPEQEIKQAVEAEREACAKVCEQRKLITPEWQLDQHYNQAVSHCAQAIRLRGRK